MNLNDEKTAARNALDRISSRLQPYASDNMQYYHGRYQLDVRCPDLFTERTGVEDDDHPEFTEHDHALRIAREEAADNFTVAILASEKCWFTIELTPTN